MGDGFEESRRIIVVSVVSHAFDLLMVVLMTSFRHSHFRRLSISLSRCDKAKE